MVKERGPLFDIESSGSECEDDPRNEPVTGTKRASNLLRSLGASLTFEGSNEGQHSTNSSNKNSIKTSDEEYADIESLTKTKTEEQKEVRALFVEKPKTKEKQKTENSKKASKPPRPLKGPSLNTTDLELVREISELVMKKRARVERLKALKKIRAAKSSSPSSSNASLFAMVVTVLFFIIIFFQGFGSSQGSTMNSRGSPEPSAAAKSGLTSDPFSDLRQLRKPNI